MTNILRKDMHPDVKKVAGEFHLALVAVLGIAMRWPDKKLAASLLHGFRIVGSVEMSNMVKPRDATGM